MSISRNALVLCAAGLMSIANPFRCQAQLPANATVYASGLNGPRGLVFGPDGYLYVAEAGMGGTNPSPSTCQQIPPPGGPNHGGYTARISRIDPSGHVTTVVDHLPSTVNNFPTHDTLGVADVAILDGTLYAVLSGGGCAHGNPEVPNGIIRVNTKTGKYKMIADLSTFFREHPTAYPDAADFDPDGVPYSLIAYRDRLFTVEANHGQVLVTTTDGATRVVQDLSLAEGHFVPTSIAENNGNLYIGNLGDFPIATEQERVLTLSRDMFFFDNTPGLETPEWSFRRFRIANSRAGFTTVISLKFGPDGLLYALELSDAAGYPTPGAGKVVRLTRKGTIEDVVTGLAVPTGMTFGPDDALYVSNLGAAPAGAGQILRIAVQ